MARRVGCPDEGKAPDSGYPPRLEHPLRPGSVPVLQAVLRSTGRWWWVQSGGPPPPTWTSRGAPNVALSIKYKVVEGAPVQTHPPRTTRLAEPRGEESVAEGPRGPRRVSPGRRKPAFQGQLTVFIRVWPSPEARSQWLRRIGTAEESIMTLFHGFFRQNDSFSWF